MNQLRDRKNSENHCDWVSDSNASINKLDIITSTDSIVLWAQLR